MARKSGVREVAKRADVSLGTVSNVLNRPEHVAPETLKRVHEAMESLGFVPNELARVLRTGAGTTLGMIVLNVANPFFADLAHASEEAGEAAGHTIVLGSSDQMSAREDRYIDVFEKQRVRGLLVTPLDGVTPRLRLLRERGIPLVLFDKDVESGFCSVALNGHEGGRMAAKHLTESGRSHIAFVGGPLHQVRDRWLGAQEVCASQRGVQLTHFDTADQTIAEGRAVGEALQRIPRADRPDAVFAANDLLAIGVLQSLVLSRDIRVPHDIAIVGYDDVDYAESAIVPLTTVHQPVHDLAKEAVRLVLDEADNPEHEHENILLEPRLILRESSRG